MSEGLKNNLTSQTPANDWVFANEVWKTSDAVSNTLGNPTWVLARIYNSVLLWKINPWEMIEDIWDLRTRQAANDEKIQKAANDEAFIKEYKKAA